MKISTLVEKTKRYLPLLACPLCHCSFDIHLNSLQCKNGHCFDLSTKGYVNLAPNHHQQADKYTAQLFQARKRIFDAGLYEPILQTIITLVKNSGVIMDVGCGEGYYSNSISSQYKSSQIIGMDLNRDAISQAAKGCTTPAWIVGDLKKLPIGDGKVDALLNILTPADYTSFSRVITPKGKLFKVIPGSRYLCEIREGLKDRLQKNEYSNQRVIDQLQNHMNIYDRIDLCNQYTLTEEQSRDMLRMTPMTFGLDENFLSNIHIKSITIDLSILCCDNK